ncbi:hypothetical protein Tco_1167549, partial [Tanacetum coccineum]
MIAWLILSENKVGFKGSFKVIWKRKTCSVFYNWSEQYANLSEATPFPLVRSPALVPYYFLYVMIYDQSRLGRQTIRLAAMADVSAFSILSISEPQRHIRDASTSYSTSRGVGEKDDAKRKSDDIRVALKEQENEVLKALYFGKTQGSIELQAFGSLGFLVVPEHQMKNYRDWHQLNS